MRSVLQLDLSTVIIYALTYLLEAIFRSYQYPTIMKRLLGET